MRTSTTLELANKKISKMIKMKRNNMRKISLACIMVNVIFLAGIFLVLSFSILSSLFFSNIKFFSGDGNILAFCVIISAVFFGTYHSAPVVPNPCLLHG
jgi:hypothetical protein